MMNTIPQSTSPMLLRRPAGDSPESASATVHTEKVSEKRVPYVSGATGTARAELFRSTDDSKASHGGVILRVTIENGGASYAPSFRVVEDGIELHLAGEAEAEALLRAIAGAIAADAR